MQRTITAIVGVLVFAVVAVTVWPKAQAATDGTYRDEFTAGDSYSGSNGSIAWTTSWVEIGEANGPGSGPRVSIESNRCTAGDCLKLDEESDPTPVGARREADLSGSVAAVLRFDYQRERQAGANDPVTEFYVEVASGASGPWTRKLTITISATDGGPQSAQVDITDQISATTNVRFISNASASDDDLFVDDVEVEGWSTVFDQDLGDRTDDEGTAVSFSASGTHPLGYSLTYSASGLPGGVSIDPSTGLVSGTISQTAASGSPYSTVITATDTQSSQYQDSFTWTVGAVNLAPSVTDPGDQTGAEGDPVSLAVVGSDPDSDSLTWSAVGLPGGLSIDPGSGVVSGTISYDASPASPFAVTVRATDPGGLFDEASFTWTVSNTNQAPQVTDPGDQSDPEGTVVSLPVAGSDADGESLTWSASGLPPGLAIQPSSGEISGAISFAASSGSPHTVTVRATDPGGLFDEVTFTWSVGDTNRAPQVTSPGDRSHAEGDPVSFAIAGSDPDGDTLTWSATGLPQGVFIDSDAGVVSGTMGYDAAAGSPHSVVVRATDPGGLFNEATFSWTVTNTNRAPSVTDPGDQDGAEGAAVSLAVTGSDPDGDALSWSASGLPEGLSIDQTTGEITGSASYVASGDHTVTVRATDPGGLFDEAAFSWSVVNTNRAPVLTGPGDVASAEGDAIGLTIAGSDPDGDPIAWTASGLPSGLSITQSGTIVGTISYEASGGYEVTVRAVDSAGANDEVSFSWTVAETNRPPTITTSQLPTSRMGEPIGSFSLAASDPDGDSFTFSASGLPGGVLVLPTTGVITGSPSAAGTFLVTITATDERGGSSNETFEMVVAAGVDLPPVAVDDEVRLAVDLIPPKGVVIDVLANDVDPEGLPLGLGSVTASEVGEIAVEGNALRFRAHPGLVGTFTVQYVAVDPAGNSDVATLRIILEEPLDVRLATGSLGVRPGVIDIGPVSFAGLTSTGAEVLLGSITQSLYVLRVPLVLLGGAVVWSLLMGGVLNLGFVVRGGVPRLIRRASRKVAVVMVPHGGRLEVHDTPGGGEVVARLTATQRGLAATGRRVEADTGDEWAELRIDGTTGWVPAFFLTEEVDKSGFAADPDPVALVRELVTRLRGRVDFGDLVSRHGLFVAHHAPLVHFPSERLAHVMDDATRHRWQGRNPAYPDYQATFDLAVATGVLDAYDHLRRELLHDEPALPSTVIPVEFTNLHFISIGADVHGPERLSQSAWLVVFTYEDGHPRIIGLVREG